MTTRRKRRDERDTKRPLTHLVDEPSDPMVAVANTAPASFSLPDAEERAFQRVRLGSARAKEELLSEEGGVLSDAEFAKKLGIRSRTTIQNYRNQGKIVAVAHGDQNVRYPAWQIHKNELLPGLDGTLRVFAEQNVEPISIVLFFLTPAEALDNYRPLDLLRLNKVEEVRDYARHYIDHR